jgi:eukaryotic-like serine/threonine-protein kinase
MTEPLAGRYRLGPLLGSGGMGEVFAAHDELLERPVAVKRVSGRVGASERDRLLQEARVAARFHHPNAVAVYDVGEHEGQPFEVMELVEGESLADRLRRDGVVPVVETVEIVGAVLTALDAAHAAGLVHRDVKPANVLLPSDGPPKLADFGIAAQVWQTVPDAATTGGVLGSPTYLAPEQAAGRPPTAAVDLYAAGVVAYELLAGKPPFVRSTPLATALAHQRDPVPPLAGVAPHVPSAVAAVVERALAKDPADRFRSAVEMRDALDAAADAPVASGGAGRSNGRQDARAVAASGGRRHPLALFGLAGLIALALVGFALGGGGGQAPSGASEDTGGAASEGGSGGAASGEDAEAVDAVDDPGSMSLGEFVDMLASDPGAAGEAGDDLLDDLLDVVREDDDKERREDALELIRDVGEWYAEGELDADVAGVAVDLLEPVGRPSGDEWRPVSEMFASLAVRSEQAGEKHVDVLDGLAKVLGEADERKRSKEARKLLDEAGKWAGDGELDGEVATQVGDVLAAVAG